MNDCVILELSDASYEAVKGYVLRNCARLVWPDDVERVLVSLKDYGLRLYSWRFVPCVWGAGTEVEAEFGVQDCGIAAYNDLQKHLELVNARDISWEVKKPALPVMYSLPVRAAMVITETKVMLRFSIFNLGHFDNERDAFGIAREWDLQRLQAACFGLLPDAALARFQEIRAAIDCAGGNGHSMEAIPNNGDGD